MMRRGLARVTLVDRRNRDPVGAGFGRQPEIDDFRQLLSDQRDEQLVEHFADARRLVRRPAGESRQVDRIAAHRDGGHSHHRKILDGVVIAGVIAKRPFRRGLVR
jgi:hypothetical protein